VFNAVPARADPLATEPPRVRCAASHVVHISSLASIYTRMPACSRIQIYNILIILRPEYIRGACIKSEECGVAHNQIVPYMSDERALLCNSEGTPYTVVNGKAVLLRNTDGTPFKRAPVIPRNEDGSPYFAHGRTQDGRYIILRRTTQGDEVVPADLPLHEIERIAYAMQVGPAWVWPTSAELSLQMQWISDYFANRPLPDLILPPRRSD
jgi:hypothetical protein